MKIELTNEEANALIELIDISVKAGGLRVASAAVTLVAKIQTAAQEKIKENQDGN